LDRTLKGKFPSWAEILNLLDLFEESGLEVKQLKPLSDQLSDFIYAVYCYVQPLFNHPSNEIFEGIYSPWKLLWGYYDVFRIHPEYSSLRHFLLHLPDICEQFVKALQSTQLGQDLDHFTPLINHLQKLQLYWVPHYEVN
jgi:hypothetical protein